MMKAGMTLHVTFVPVITSSSLLPHAYVAYGTYPGNFFIVCTLRWCILYFHGLLCFEDMEKGDNVQ